jgi:hypothetical protein
MVNITQDDDSGSSILWVSGKNPQETRRFWPEPAGKCQEFDSGNPVTISGCQF